MYSKEEIKIRSKLVIDAVNCVMTPRELSVDKIFLVGSYASNRANEYSDIDYLVQLKGGKRPLTYPEFRECLKIKELINNSRIHVIYGTLEAQESMKKRDPIKYAWQEI